MYQTKVIQTIVQKQNYTTSPTLQTTKVKRKNNYFSSIENQRNVLQNIFIKLNLKELEDWKKVSLQQLRENGGSFIGRYYSNNFKKLLRTIYPTHNWQFQKEILHKTSRNYFDSFENQKNFMDDLFLKLKLNSLDDWLKISRKKIAKYGGHSLLIYYSNDMKKLLSSVYPHHNWHFSNLKIFNKTNFLLSLENQKKFMNFLFYHFKLISLEDWLKISKKKFIKNGGTNLLVYQYENNFHYLLSSIYPNYPWNFQRNSVEFSKQTNEKNGFNKKYSLEEQREKIDKLFAKLKLNSFGDWKNINKKQIIQNGGKTLLLSYYSNNIDLLLRSLYPNYPWEIVNKINNLNDENNFQSIENQQKFMDDLFIKLKLKSLDEWLNITKKIIVNNGGKNLMIYFSKNKFKLLEIIYPNFPWNFSYNQLKLNPIEYFKSISNQKIYMNYLFNILNLKSIDDWLQVSENSFITHNGKILLYYYYSNDIKKLLSTIYPDHLWNFDQLKLNLNEYFNSIDNQRNFMEKLFIKFQLKSLDDWLFISKFKLKINGGKKLLEKYNNDIKKLITSLYPNHNWNFQKWKYVQSKEYFQSFENQKNFMEELFKKLHLKSVEEWKFISRNKIEENGGKNLLKLYGKNKFSLLKTIYPNYQWKKKELLSKESQFYLIEFLFKLFQLNNLKDWKEINVSKMIKNGGKKLLEIYSFDIQFLLSSLYPNYPWEFRDEIKIKSNFSYYKNILLNIQRKYSIQQKKDWYRIPLYIDHVFLFPILKIIHNNEEWKRSSFLLRTKRTMQRNLFLSIQSIFFSHLIYENYRYPLLKDQYYNNISNDNNYNLEYDIFIPTYNMAIEYQGEHHYDDIPSGFNFLELYQSRDQVKRYLTAQNQIILIDIPYWWNHSLSSLHSSILLLLSGTCNK